MNIRKFLASALFGALSLATTPLLANPVFNNTAANAVAENQTSAHLIELGETIPLHNITSVTIDPIGDGALFNLGPPNPGLPASGLLGTKVPLRFNVAPNFESPADGNGDNVYLVRIRAVDNLANAVTQNISITVQDVNEPPIVSSQISDQSGVGHRDGITLSPSLNVSGSFTDPDAGDSMTFSASGLPNGLSISSAGVISGTFAANASVGSPHSVTVTAKDAAGGLTVDDVFNWTVTNPAPVATGSCPGDVSNDDGDTLSGINIATCFSDDDALTFSTVSTFPNNAVLQANGDVTGTIAEDASQGGAAGVYTITLTATDAQSATTDGDTFTWTISNVAPVATANTSAINEDGTTDAGNVITDDDGNGVDADGSPDGDALSVTAITHSLQGAGTVGGTATGDYGSLAMLSTGAYTYTIDNLNATVQALDNGETLTETYTYTLNDGEGGTDTADLVVTITGIDDAPTTTGITDQADDDGTTGISVDLSAFFSPSSDNGDSIASYAVDGSSTHDVTDFGLSLNTGTGEVSGTIDNDASQGGVGGVYSITIVATDDDGETVTDTFTWTISNVAPVATANTSAINEDGTTDAGNVITDDDGNGVDADGSPDGDALSVTAITHSLQGAGTVGGTATGDYGSLAMLSTGAYTYTIDNLNATVQALDNGETLTETYTYTLNDGEGGTDTADLVVTITGIDDAPTTTGITDQADDDGTTGISVDLSAFFSPSSDNGDSIASYAVDGSSTHDVTDFGLSLNTGTGEVSGTIDNDASQGGVGGVYSITIVATDDDGETVTDTFTWTISNVAPVATANTSAINEDGTTDAGNVITDDDGNGVDADGSPDGDALSVTAITHSLQGAGTVGGTATGDYGSLAMLSTGAYTYTIDNLNATVQALDNGETLTETYTYTLNDGEGGTDTADLVVTITGIDDAPTTTGITDQADDDGTTGISVDLSAFFSPSSDNGDSIASYAVDGSSTHDVTDFGLSLNTGTGEVSGTIDNDASQGGVGGVYSITIVATDDDGETVTDTFTWTISNVAPVATANTSAINEDGTTDAGNVITDDDGNGVDADGSPDGDALSVTAITHSLQGAGTVGGTATGDYGSLAMLSTGAYTYTIDNLNATVQALDNGETLTETYTYTLNDGEGGTDTADLVVTITGIDDAPTTTGITDQADDDGTTGISVDLSAFFSPSSDNGDSIASYAVDGSSTHDVTDFGLSLNTGTGEVSGTIDNDASQGGVGGVYSITIVATDDDGETVTDTFTWTISNVAPVATANTSAINEDGTTDAGNVITDDDGNGVDADGSPDGDALSVTAITHSLQGAGTVGGTATGDYGSLAMLSTGAYTYTIDNLNATVQALDNGETLTETYTYTLNDGEGGTDTADLVVTITGIDDAPTTTGITDQADDDGTTGISVDLSAFFSPSSDNGDSIASYAVDGSSTHDVTDFGLSLNTGTGEVSGTIDNDASQGGVGGVYSITIVATDDDGETVTDTFTWTISNVAPVATANTSAINEDGTTDAGNVITDDDGNGVDADGSPDGDALSVTAITHSLQGAGTVGGTATGDYGSLAMLSTGAYTYTIDNLNATVQALDNGETLTETYTYTLNDGEGGTDTADLVVTITGINDAPVISSNSGATLDVSSNENSTATITTIVADDVDGDDGSSGVALVFDIDLGGGADGGFFTINAGSGALSFTSAPNYEAQSDANGDNVYEVTVRVADDSGATDTQLIRVALQNVNEVPSATNMSDSITYTEDDASVDLTNIVVSDIDDSLTAQAITVTLTLNDINAGALSTPGSSSYTSGTGVWEITDTLANVNAALAGVAFIPTADHDTDTTITTHVEDQGGLGPADGTISLNVTTVNDAPLATNLTVTTAYTEDAASVALTDIVVSDIDNNDVPQTFTATLTLADTAAGSLTAASGNGETFVGGVWSISGATLTEVNAALAAVAFVPAADYDTDTSITTHVEDQDGAGPADGSISLDVTPVNDAPLATNLTDTIVYSEDAVSVNLTNIVVSDVDDNDVPQTFTVTLTLADTAAGSLTAASGNGETFVGGVWSITGSLTAVNTALAAVAFEPNGDYDTDTSIATHVEDQDNTGPIDGTITLDVTPINDAPLATNLTDTVTYTEDAGSVDLADIVVSDVDDGDVSQTITVTLTLADFANAGVLTTSGSATYSTGTGVWTITDTIANVNTALAAVAFEPSADYDTDTSITTHVEDQDGAGPVDGLITLDVTPVNDAPLATNLTNTVAYNEDDASVDLTNIVVSDVDDADVPQTITVTLTLADHANAGSLTTSGSATYSGATGVWTITDTVANVNTALASVAFLPNADYDSDTSIATQVVDQDGAGPANGTITLDVTPGNDAPLATNMTDTVPYNEDAGSVALADIVVSDVDDADVPQTITATLTLNDPDAGALTISGSATYAALTGVWTITDTLANVNTALAAVAFEPSADYDTDTSITTHVEDQDGAGPADGTITLDVTPSNDAPAGTNMTDTVTYLEDAVSVDLTNIVVSDVDDGDVPQTITVTLTLADHTNAGALSTPGASSYSAATGIWTMIGTVANVNAALAAVAFEPNADYDTDTTITTHVEDQLGAGPADGVITLDVTPVNDAPLATNLTDTIVYAEDTASIDLADIVISDVDEADVPQTMTATLTLNDPDAGLLTVSGTASYTAGTGVWTITDSLANVNAALASVAFEPNTNYDTDTSITTRVQDQDGAGPANGTITLDVTPANDAPTATNLTSTAAYTEDQALVNLDDIVVSDVDDTDVAQTITVTLTLADFANAGTLTQPGSSSYNAGTGVWTITDTVANVNAALASLQFAPATNYDTDTTIATHVEDQDGAGPVDGVITLDVTPVNDNPTATNTTGTITYDEDELNVDIPNIVISDVDDNDVPQTITVTFTLTDYLPVSFSQPGASTFDSDTGVWTITGTLASVNAALALVDFDSTLNWDTDSSFTIQISDQDLGGPAVSSIILDVDPLNDAPEIVDQAFSIDENTANGTVVGTVIATNVESVGCTPGVDPLCQNLTFQISGTAFDIDDDGVITVADVTELDRETVENFPLTVTVEDDGVPIRDASAIVTITLNAVNDNTPVGSDDVMTLDEQATTSINVLTFGTDDSDADVPAETLTVSAVAGDPANVGVPMDLEVSGVVVGSLTINADGAATFVASADNTVEQFEVTQTYTVSDGTFEDPGVVVTVQLNPLNDNQPELTTDGTDFAAAGVDYDEGRYTSSNKLTVVLNTFFRDLDIDADGILDGSTSGDNDSLTFSVTSNTNPALVSTGISGGDLTIWSPAQDHGTADITIRAVDSAAPASNISSVDLTFTVTVNSINDAPTYVNGSLPDMTLNEDSAPITLDLDAAFYDNDIDNDADPSDDLHTYTITIVDVPAIFEVENVHDDTAFTPTLVSETLNVPQPGSRTTVYTTTDPSIDIEFEPDAHGYLDITVRATDTGRPPESPADPVFLFDEETFRITVQGIGDDTPDAEDDHYNDFPELIMDEDGDPITFDVLANDYLGDAPTSVLSAGVLITDSFGADHAWRTTSRLTDRTNTGDFVIEINGEVSCAADGCQVGQTVDTSIDGAGLLDSQIIYKPDLDFNGEDSFTYCIQDAFPGSEPAFTPPTDQRCATVTVLVNPVNDLPRVPNDIIYTMAQAEDLIVPVDEGLATFVTGVDNTHVDGLGCNPNDPSCNPGPGDPQPDTLYFFFDSYVVRDENNDDVGLIDSPAPTDGSFAFRPLAAFSGSASFLIYVCETAVPSADTCVFDVPVTIIVDPIQGAPEGSSDEVVQYDFDLADTPLELPVGPEANVMIVNDDSGSMDWDIMTTQSDGLYFFDTGNYIYYTMKATAGNSSYVAPGEADAPNVGLWRLRNSEYNRIYYSPEVRYDPWDGLDPDDDPFQPADPLDALHNPMSPNGDGTNLRQPQDYTGRAVVTQPVVCQTVCQWYFKGSCVSYTQVCTGGSGFQQVQTNDLYLPRYYTWDDKDGDGYMDEVPSPAIDPANSEGILTEIRPASEGGSDTYTKYENRTDCAAADHCTFEEELQNFANWFTYSRNREFTAKSALGRVVASAENIRVGYAKLNSTSNTRQIESMNASERTGAKADLLDAIYLTGSSGGTPLRRALRDTGRYFACRSGDIFDIGTNRNPGDANCPVFASPGGNCQQNFALLISDGTWNGGSPNIGDEDDNDDSNFDGGRYAGSYDNSLADVAMKYYEEDLFSSLPNEVPTNARDTEGAAVDAFENGGNDLMHQHMKTFTVGFGVTGLIDPADVPTAYDYVGFNWGSPTSSARKTDDLLHAAVNGRGEYLSAANSQALAEALVSAFEEFQQGSGAASAVSFNSQEILEDTLVFRSFYNTKNNTGDLIAQPIDPDGTVGDPVWNASVQLDLIDPDDRVIITLDRDPNSANFAEGIPFRPLSLNAEQRAAFTSAADVAQQNLEVLQRVNYLRGDDTNERPNGNFRERPGIQGRLGDIVHSAPTFIGAPSRLGRDAEPFPQDSLYSQFKGTYELRDEIVYVSANDGMLHGFEAETGDELIAYVPDNLMTAPYSRNITELLNYEYQHKYFVDLTPAINDVYIDSDGDGDKEWTTILIGGQGAGGKAYFALNITDPTYYTEAAADQVAMWEFTDEDDAYPTDNLGTPLKNPDDSQRMDQQVPPRPVKDLGYTYSVPSIVMSNAVDGDDENLWVAIAGNGYNSTAGIAKLFILFLDGGVDGVWCHPDKIHNEGLDGTPPDGCSETDQDFVKLNTGFGVQGGVPNGLGEPRAIDTDANGTADYVYAGDMFGNFFRFDITDSDYNNWSVTKIFQAQYKPGTVDETDQPITTQPIAVVHPTEEEGFIIIFGTGAYMRTGDSTDESIQSIYGLWDRLGPELIDKSDLQEQSYTNLVDSLGLVRTLSQNPVDYSIVTGQKGWYIDLDSPPAGFPDGSAAEFPGEKAVRNIQLRGGLAFVNSIFPRELNSCVGRAGGATLSFCPDTGSSLCFSNRTIFDLNNDGAFDDGDDVNTDQTAAGIILEDPSPPTDSTFIGDKRVTQYGRDLHIIGTNTSSGNNTGRLSWKRIETVD